MGGAREGAGRPKKASLARVIAADPDLARTDRIAIALAMSADQFSIDDIARVTSVRRQTIIGLRQQTGLPPRPQSKRSMHANRPLDPVVEALAADGRARLTETCLALGIHQVSGWGILRAIEYASSLEAAPGTPRRLRCPGCEQVTEAHPCKHCGTAWLSAERVA